MQVVCVWHSPPKLLFEKEPLEDKTVIETICQECYGTIRDDKPTAQIPEELGQCEITRVEEEGDLHVLCGEKYYKVGVDATTVEEGAPPGLEIEKVDFVKMAEESNE